MELRGGGRRRPARLSVGGRVSAWFDDDQRIELRVSVSAGGAGTKNVGSYPLGDGKWGHADLAGNVAEWTIDFFKATYNETTCTDCAFTYAPGEYFRMIRGGAFNGDPPDILVSKRGNTSAARRAEWSGFRCARKP